MGSGGMQEGDSALLFIESGLIQLSFDRKCSISQTVATRPCCCLGLLVETDSAPSSCLMYEALKQGVHRSPSSSLCHCNNEK